MKTLFIYDSSLIPEKIDSSIFGRDDAVWLFPLTSIIYITDFISKKIKNVKCYFEIVQTAEVINQTADNLRDKYIKFIAEIPKQIKCNGKDLREFFAINKYATLWWFSLISEKNLYKSDAFNGLVQLDSIISIIKKKKIEKVIFWCKNNKLRDALSEYLFQNAIRFDVLPISNNYIYGLKQRILKIEKIFFIRQILSLLCFAVQLFLRMRKIKKNISGLKRTIDVSHNRLLLITPYPNIDIKQAKKGIFKNNFYPYLQEALEDEGQDMVWIAMYVSNNSMSFSDSLKYAQEFIMKGYRIFFLEEFSSIRMQIGSLLTIFKNGLRYVNIEKDVRYMHSFGEYNFYSIFKEDWYLSFSGHIGYQGILYYKMFESLLRKLKASKCLYLCEMHAWEKALILARETVGYPMSLYGYQSGTVSRMLLNYFNHPCEIIDSSPYPMPCPEKVICDGRLPYSYIRDSGWPEDRVSVVEAIRYNHLKKQMTLKCDKKKNVVLLTFSISPQESSAMLNMAYESLKDLNGIEVWMKTHPFLHLKDVLNLSGISDKDICFSIKDDPIETLLSEAKIVVSGQSGVSVQALLYGCHVVVANVPEWINMSPLKNTKSKLVTLINSPEELRQLVIDIFKEELNFEQYIYEAREIINEYFFLDQHSDIPDKFLRLLKSNGGDLSL